MAPLASPSPQGDSRSPKLVVALPLVSLGLLVSVSDERPLLLHAAPISAITATMARASTPGRMRRRAPGPRWCVTGSFRWCPSTFSPSFSVPAVA